MKTTHNSIVLLLVGLFAFPTFAQESVRDKYPNIEDVEEKEVQGRRFVLATINGLKGIIGTEESMLSELASAGNVSFDDFADYNELEESARIQPGQVYYFEEKKKEAPTTFHTLAKDQSIWEVSQKYGIRKKYIYKYNRLKRGRPVRSGLVLWLQGKRPRSVEPEYRKPPQKEPLWGQEPPKPPQVTELPPEENGKDFTSELDKELQEIWQRPEIQAKLPAKPADDDKADNGNDFMEGGMDGSGLKGESDLPGGINIGGDTPSTSFDPDTQGGQTTQEYVYHTVQPAESLYMISRMYGVQPRQIQGWNNFKGEPREGERIIVGIQEKNSRQDFSNPRTTEKEEKEDDPFGSESSPKTGTENDGYIRHTVKPGESLYMISRQYGVTVDQLKTWNDIKGMDVPEGESIIVGEGDADSAPATDFTDLESVEPKSDNSSTGNNASPFSDSPFLESSEDNTETAPLFGSAPSQHTVRSGETLWEIAENYGVAVDDLKEWNDKEDGQVKAGETLYVSADAVPGDPLPAPQEVENGEAIQPGTYRVKGGDTFWKLEKEFGVTAEQIKKWNGIEKLYANELIIVSDPNSMPAGGQSKSMEADSTENPPFGGIAESKKTNTNPSLQQRGLVPPARSAGEGVHVVQPEETTYYIAALYDIRHSQLVAWNHLTDEKLKNVKPGDELVVSETAFLSQGQTNAKRVGSVEYHTVKQDETLYSISQKYGVTLSQLREWNGKNNTDQVYRGERLVVQQ